MTTRVSNRRQHSALISAELPGLLWLALVAVSSNATGAVYRCTVDEHVVYSDRPCGAQATRVEIEQAPAAKPTDLQRTQDEANLGHVVVGMTPVQTEQAWGRPREIGLESDGSGSVLRWTYDRAGEVVTVHFTNGKVAKIASVKSLAPPATEAVPGASAQLTLSELEARERNEKATERRFAHTGMTQEEVRGKLGPPSDRQVRNTLMGVGDCWTYQPAARDPATVTTICFSVDYLRAMSVDRNVQR